MQIAAAKVSAKDTIRKQATGPAVRSYARSLPQFQPVADVPQYMRDMLKRIEDAEATKARN